MRPGVILKTGRDLDVAMDAQTVMGVTAPNGELAFTRRGDLRLNAQGVLETGSNNVVLSDQGNPITIPPGLDLSITKDGDIFARDPQQPPETPAVLIARMMTRDASQITLQRREDTLYTPHIQFRTPNGDFASGPLQPQIVPGALEASNVNPVTAMVKLIDFSRSFETQIRTIKEAKSLDEAGASMLRAR
jgi:flagellar basal-body rod protein FlgF